MPSNDVANQYNATRSLCGLAVLTLAACQPTLGRLPPTLRSPTAQQRPLLEVAIHWQPASPAAPATAEITLQQAVRVTGNQLVLRDHDYLALGTSIDSVPMVETADGARLVCTRNASRGFGNDTQTSELRLPLAAKAAVHCLWPGGQGIQRITIRARVALPLVVSHELELVATTLRLRTRFTIATRMLRDQTQAHVGNVTIWQWDHGQRSGSALTHQRVVFDGATAVLDQHREVAVQRRIVLRDDGDESLARPLLVFDELETSAQGPNLPTGDSVMLRLPTGKLQALPSGNLRRNGVTLALNSDVVASHRSKEYAVHDGTAQSHKFVIHNLRDAPVTIDCWERRPVLATQVGFWLGPNATTGPVRQRGSGLVTPITVAAKTETWLARSWRLP